MMTRYEMNEKNLEKFQKNVGVQEKMKFNTALWLLSLGTLLS